MILHKPVVPICVLHLALERHLYKRVCFWDGKERRKVYLWHS